VMERRTVLQGMGAMMMASAAKGLQGQSGDSKSDVVYELRVYHTAEGKLNDLLARFRDHTVAIFTKHGLKSVAYWVPIEEPLKGRTLIYILEHPSREAATANWKSFQADPEWVKVKAASEVNGQLVEKIDSTYMALTDFSPPLR
jgi:NIPSNAP